MKGTKRASFKMRANAAKNIDYILKNVLNEKLRCVELSFPQKLGPGVSLSTPGVEAGGSKDSHV